MLTDRGEATPYDKVFLATQCSGVTLVRVTSCSARSEFSRVSPGLVRAQAEFVHPLTSGKRYVRTLTVRRPLQVAAFVLSSAFVLAVPAAAQRSGEDEMRVTLALQKYQTATLRSDTPTLVALFTSDASIAHESQPPIVGRDSIAKFLASFAQTKVRAYTMIVTAQAVTGDSATQTGTYEQTVRPPDGKELHVRGTFRATWMRQPDKRWLLFRMRTASRP